LEKLRSVKSAWSQSSIARSLGILSRNEKKKVTAITLVQVTMGFLDLLGVVAIGLLGALSITNLQSKAPGNRVNKVMEVIHLDALQFQTQVIALGGIASILLVGKTLLSVYFTRKILFYFSYRGAELSSNLISKLLSQPLLMVQARTSQETLYALTTGVSLITLQVLATSVVLVADVSLLLILTLGLFIIDPITATGTSAIFLLVGLCLFLFMHNQANKLGEKSSNLNILSNMKITEVVNSYRESVVRNRRNFYARMIGDIRFDLANTTAELNFMPYVSKYVIETFIIVGGLFLGGIQFYLNDINHAVATLSIFLAAGTRIAPAVLRVQQGAIMIRSSLGQAIPTLNLIESLRNSTPAVASSDKLVLEHKGFNPKIRVKDLYFKYPNQEVNSISEVSMNIEAGSSVAIVGPSGAGKTTLVDLILGVLNPQAGTTLISGHTPQEAISIWPGAIAYVPQDVIIINGTIRENISIGYPIHEASDSLVMGAIRIANLEEYVLDLPNGLDTNVGESGSKLSGGQRQRLGIARAMFTQPKLLILDESTSSLDAEAESVVNEALVSLKGATTVILIAHRLTAVKNVDQIFYIDSGKIAASGTFEQLRLRLVDFDRQAKLMGL
jgi:ABC-type multidrug transport system fused ATPase/permease subunit